MSWSTTTLQKELDKRKWLEAFRRKDARGFKGVMLKRASDRNPDEVEVPDKVVEMQRRQRSP
jgi:hypothetical protein